MSSYRDVTREVKSESDRLIKKISRQYKTFGGFLTQILLPLKFDYLQKIQNANPTELAEI